MAERTRYNRAKRRLESVVSDLLMGLHGSGRPRRPRPVEASDAARAQAEKLARVIQALPWLV
jgi:hypothetical protein